MSGARFTSAFAADLEGYLAFKQNMGCYGASRIWYMQQFDAWCAEHSRTIFDQGTVEGWVTARLESPGRYRSWMSYIRDFGRWLQATGHELAETYTTSQPTISPANSRITSRLAIALAPFVPTAEDLDPDTQYIYDGTLLPCWSWRGHRELYSGKRKTTGKNVQVACNLYGELAWISDPVDGSRHDAHCIDESSVLAGFPEGSQMGDKGYIGKGMVTPIRKPECRDLLDREKEFSTQVNKIRYMIEQVIANFKTWGIMHTDYRRPIGTFDTTISAVVGLHFYRMA